jgi:hypothetical protein
LLENSTLVEIVSTEETEEQRQYVQRSPADGGTVAVSAVRPATVVVPAAVAAPATVAVAQAPAVVVPAAVAAPATVAVAPATQRNETVVTHRSTNMGAIVALAIGVIVLVGGIGLIDSQVKFLPWPYNIITVLGFGVLLLLVGASFISRGTERP